MKEKGRENMALFKKAPDKEPTQENQVGTDGKVSLSLSTDEINLLRECMKRTEDYYRGLLLLKQDWNAEKNEQAIAIIKIKLNMIDRLQEKTLYEGQPEYYRQMQ